VPGTFSGGTRVSKAIEGNDGFNCMLPRKVAVGSLRMLAVGSLVSFGFKVYVLISNLKPEKFQFRFHSITPQPNPQSI
jgi:hypothetical protein